MFCRGVWEYFLEMLSFYWRWHSDQLESYLTVFVLKCASNILLTHFTEMKLFSASLFLANQDKTVFYRPAISARGRHFFRIFIPRLTVVHVNLLCLISVDSRGSSSAGIFWKCQNCTERQFQSLREIHRGLSGGVSMKLFQKSSFCPLQTQILFI